MCCFSHELFSRRRPNSRDSDNPTDVLVKDDHSRLVSQFLYGVVLEKAKCKLKNDHCWNLLLVCGGQHEIFAQILQKRKGFYKI